MDLIGPELSELFTLEFAKIAEYDCLHPSTYKCRPFGTKHCHNIYIYIYIYDTEILDKFDYGANPRVTSGVICPSIRKSNLI